MEILDKYRVPIGGVYFRTEKFSTLFGVDVDNAYAGSQAANLADRILKGTPIREVPVISARKFFQLDLKEAERLGIKISDDLLGRFNRIIK